MSAVAGDVWWGLVGLMVAWGIFRGIDKPYVKYFLGVLILPMGPLWLLRAIHGLFTGRIAFLPGGTQVRPSTWTQNPGFFLYTLFGHLALGALSVLIAAWCFY
jgi:hypothetical protein